MRKFTKGFASFGCNHKVLRNNSTFGIYPFNKEQELDMSINFGESVEDVYQSGIQLHHIANTAYPISHGRTFSHYQIKDKEEIKKHIEATFGALESFGLYFHIPFCFKRCRYCEYTVLEPENTSIDVENLYINSLCKEIDLYDQILNFKGNKKPIGMDIGGGTPMFLESNNIIKLMEKISNSFNWSANAIENGISIETTPAIAAKDKHKIQLCKDLGINRISMGLQSIDLDMTKKLDRDENNSDNFKAIENMKNCGFEEINIDLMYGFPNFTPDALDKWIKTLEYTISLEPEFITLYRMRYKGTKMEAQKEEVKLDQVNLEEDIARKILFENGYVGDIGKNTYSKIKDNTGASKYLTNRVVQGTPYLGFGLGAQSYSNWSLSYNQGAASKTIEPYLKAIENDELPIQDYYYLSKNASIGKFCSVSFYFGGILSSSFYNLFGECFEEYFREELEWLIEQELIVKTQKPEGTYYAMTKKGKHNFGGVVSQFYSRSIKSYLVETKDSGEVFDWSYDIQKNGTAEKLILNHKTKETENYLFGNILFAGECSQKCPFCIGKQIDQSVNKDNLSVYPPKNLKKFIKEMNKNNCRSVILTGTTTDPSLYKYEGKLLENLRKNIWDCKISLHTNGQFLDSKTHEGELLMNLYDTVTISLPSFDQEIFEKMTGVSKIPDLENILKKAEIPIKVSVVVSDDNIGDIHNFLRQLSELGIKRVAVRHLNDDPREWNLFSEYDPESQFHGNDVFRIYGMEITYWKFCDVTQKSLNLFADGTLSDNYSIAQINKIN